MSRITRFDPSEFTSQVGGDVKDFSPKDYMDGKESRRMDLFALFAVVSALQAVEDAGLKNGGYDPERLGVIIGNGIGGIETLETNFKKLFARGPKSIHPLTTPMMIANIAGANIAIKLNAQGPCHTVITACASATDAIGDGYRWIKQDGADIIVAGGTEGALTPMGLASFCVLQAVSTRRNNEPDKASRPFDKERDGFILAEGAGVLVLEELEHAKKRGAQIYAEVAGYGVSCDANHLTAPHPE
ncbi:MAG: beta-ketoacyl-[acyl-carrier-protein] synthase II, partial [Planctomycetes bacterium]|nr:beta-ketoacyl-[acyl-carrier-protein] synthase II [Planctomycetota bacterium]